MVTIVRNGALIAAVLLVGGIWWLLFDTPGSVGRKEAVEAVEPKVSTIGIEDGRVRYAEQNSAELNE